MSSFAEDLERFQTFFFLIAASSVSMDNDDNILSSFVLLHTSEACHVSRDTMGFH